MGVYLPIGYATQGPCPDGFHIPTTEDWGQFQAIYAQLVPSGDRDKSLLLFPAKHKLMEAGPWNGSVAQNIKVTEYDDLYYRSCNSVSLTRAYGFFVSSNGYPQPTNYKSPKGRATSIRGFRNAPIVPSSSRNVLYQGAGNAGIYHNSGLGVISLSNDGSTRVTIADKDLGASSIQGQGYLFQWGNNYGGFNRNVGTYTSGYSSTAIDAGSYGPGNYYSGNTPIFVYGSPGCYWDNSNNGNLWGGVDGNVPTMSELKNAYIGEYGWTPGANTLLYLPLKSDLNDHSGNNNNPTSSSNATITTLNGVNCCFLDQGRIVLPQIGSVFNSTFTVAGWINITGTKGNGYNCIMGAGISGSYNAFGFAGYYKSGRNEFSAGFYAGASASIDTSSYSGGRRHFLATFDENKKLTLYLNGSAVANATASTPHMNDNTLYVGVNTEVPDDTSWMSYCYLGDLILENKAWTSDEVTKYYNLTKSKYGL